MSDRDALIQSHLHLARITAQRFGRYMPQSLDFEDLVSAGMLGLVYAARDFDSAQGVQFTTYAIHRIRGCILEALRGWSWYPRSLTEPAAARGERLADVLSLDRCYSESGEGDTLANLLPDTCESVEAAALCQSARESLASAIALLCERDRRVIHLYYNEAWTHKRIGAEFGISESRAYQIHKEAVNRLRKNAELMSALA